MISLQLVCTTMLFRLSTLTECCWYVVQTAACRLVCQQVCLNNKAARVTYTLNPGCNTIVALHIASCHVAKHTVFDAQWPDVQIATTMAVTARCNMLHNLRIRRQPWLMEQTQVYSVRRCIFSLMPWLLLLMQQQVYFTAPQQAC